MIPFLLKALFFAALPISAVSAIAPPSSPARLTVEKIIKEARNLDPHAKNAKTIEGLVDFTALADGALNGLSSRMTASQKLEIESLLKKIIAKMVYPQASAFFKDVTIDFTNEEQKEDVTHITSVVTKGSRRSTVEYWLKPRDGTFEVVDLAIGGERWVENVHEQFTAIAEKNGVAGLIAKMRKRLSQLDSKKS